MRLLRALPTMLLLFVPLLLVGCAPFQQPYGTPYRSPILLTDVAIMRDATRLPLRRWEAERPTAMIIGVHGFNDYSRMYELAGPWFAERGISVYAYDQRGFGAAPGAGRWPGSVALTSDLKTIVALLKDQHQGLPIFVIGASMGGAVALASAADDGLPVDGVILAAPAVWGWSSMSVFLKAPLWVSAHVAPSKMLTGEGLERWPSDNTEMLRELFRDPLVIKETRIDAIYGLVGLMDEAYLSVPRVTKPVLLLYGEKDEIVPPEPIDAVAKQFTSPLTYKTYPDGWHMLLRDKQRETVWRDIEAWIKDHEGNTRARGS
ncbi:MAG: alpha/beta hydrolase [Parvibaculum sp.]